MHDRFRYFLPFVAPLLTTAGLQAQAVPAPLPPQATRRRMLLSLTPSNTAILFRLRPSGSQEEVWNCQRRYIAVSAWQRMSQETHVPNAANSGIGLTHRQCKFWPALHLLQADRCRDISGALPSLAKG